MICLSKVSKAKVSRARSIQWVRHNVEQKSYSTGFCAQLCTARISRYLQHCFLILPQNHLTVGRYVPKSCLNTARIRNLEEQHPLRDPRKRCAQNAAKINWSMKLWALYKNIPLDTIYVTALYYHTLPWVRNTSWIVFSTLETQTYPFTTGMPLNKLKLFVCSGEGK